MMDFFYSYSDPLVIVSATLGIILTAIFLREVSFYLRRIIPQKVTCWFCHEETLISYDYSNSWVCDKCEQYNGFTKNGDYNREIPNQHEEKFNASGFTYQFDNNFGFNKNQLCEECNLKQQFKVQQLAEFVPMVEKNYDKEIEHFRKQIEKGLALCQDCENLVSRVLQNVREELSLPKRLSAAISKINPRGQRAIAINIILSMLLVFYSLNWELSLSSEFKAQINQSLSKNKFIGQYFTTVSNHTLTSAILSNTLLILIGTGIFTNSFGFYLTNSPAVFLNVVSWTLMFFLTLYPSGYEYAINILKVVASSVSLAIGILLLLRNYYQRNKVKPSPFGKRNSYAALSTPSYSFHPRSPSVATACSTPIKERRSPKGVPYQETSPYGISSGIRNLSLGVSQRKGLSRPPLINPAKFNPFSNISPTDSYSSVRGSERNFNASRNDFKPCLNKTSPLDRTGSVFSKSGEGGRKAGGLFYEPSLTPPSSVLEGYDPVPSLPSYPYPQPCYPCTPTYAYYFSTQPFPKPSPPNTIPFSSTPKFDCDTNKTETSIFWKVLYCVPIAFVFFCNVFFMFILYTKGK